MSETILVVNAGSSSIKFQLFAIGDGHSLERLLKGQIDGIGIEPHLVVKGRNGERLADQFWTPEIVPDVPVALENVVQFLRAHLGGELPVAVGHRVVHGGVRFAQPTIVTGEVLDELDALAPLAPLHQPNNLAPMRAIHERFGHLLQVACFDTAFHRGHPELADRFALTEPLYAEGVRRYGFHGLSYEYIASRLRRFDPKLANGKTIVAHLGSGASMCALVGGRSVESTMGYTALDGLPMGTRPGQLDAGVVLYLMRQKGMSADEIEHFLYHDCGLKGLSGISNDVRVLLASLEAGARLALDYFVYRIAVLAGSLAAAMGGLDGFVFTAGIGENAPDIREAVARRLGWLGMELDQEANLKGGPRISAKDSRISCFVIPTDEELMIAQHALDCMHSRQQREKKVLR